MGLWGNTAQQPPQAKKFINISVDQVNSNQQAVPVKYLAGRNYLAGDYISPCYNPVTKAIKSGAGKSQNSTTGYKYFADFGLMFCMGGRAPVDSFHTLIVDSDIRWSGNVTRDPNGPHPHKAIVTVDKLGTLHLYWGTETQPIDNVLLTPRETLVGGGSPLDQTTWPPNTGSVAAGDENPFSGHYDRHPAYRGQCYGVFIDWKLGRDRTAVPNIQIEIARGCPAPWVGGGFASSDESGVNPIAVLYDWLTDTRFGMGLPDSSLNLATFASTYNQLETLGARISPLITSQEDFRQVIAQLLEYFDGWIRINQTQLEVGLWSHGAVISSATLTDDDLLGEPELEPQGWGPTVNEVTVVYKDRQHHYNDYTQVYRDPNNFRITGTPRPETLNRPWITDATVAKTYARTTGAVLAMPFTQGTLKVRREWLTNSNMLPGKIFEYDSGFYDLSFLLRLNEIEYGEDAAAFATLSVEWERSRWPSLYIPPPFQGPGGFTIGPRGLYASRITEVPYLIADHQFVTQIVPLAVRGEINSQSFRVWVSFDGGSTYQVVPDSASTSSFCAFGVSTGDNGTAMYFYLYGVGLDEVVSFGVDATPAQQNDDTLLCFCDAEVMSIGTVNALGGGGYYSSMLRARLGTTLAGHPAGSNMYFIFRDRLTMIDNAGFVPGATVLFKLQPFTDEVDFDLDSITPISYTISGFADIPSPVFSPASGSFSSTLAVSLSSPPAGFTARYTANGAATTPTSSAWTGTVTLSATTTLRARFYSQSGRASMENISTYILSGTTATCGAPTWTFSGTLNHSTGNITITQTTPSSTIHYSINGGSYSTSSSPLVVALNCSSIGDTIEFYASASTFIDSPHSFVDNRGTISCLAPSYTFSGTQHATSGNITLINNQVGGTLSYILQYGSITAYSTPVALACTFTGDLIEFWASASGLSDSTHITFDNTGIGGPMVNTPSFTYTGTPGSSVMVITLIKVAPPSTASQTLHYIKNGTGGTITYSTPVSLGLGGQTLEFWASASGYADSNHVNIWNDVGGPGP